MTASFEILRAYPTGIEARCAATACE